MAKKNFYAVIKGHRIGIFRDCNQATSQVQGFSNAQCQGFAFRDQADNYLIEYANKFGYSLKDFELLEDSVPLHLETVPTRNDVGDANVVADAQQARNSNPNGSDTAHQMARPTTAQVMVTQSVTTGADGTSTAINICLPETGAQHRALQTFITISSARPLACTTVEVDGLYITTLHDA